MQTSACGLQWSKNLPGQTPAQGPSQAQCTCRCSFNRFSPSHKDGDMTSALQGRKQQPHLFSVMDRGMDPRGAARMPTRRSSMGMATPASSSGCAFIASSPAQQPHSCLSISAPAACMSAASRALDLTGATTKIGNSEAEYGRKAYQSRLWQL